MKIILCIDDNNGMMFGNKRQSQDKTLREDILRLIKNRKLYMNQYSYTLFKDVNNKPIIVYNDLPLLNLKDDYCFIENTPINSFNNKISTIILYKWNRSYPSTLKFDMDLSSDKWELIETCNFRGSSHEKITRDTYRRRLNEN